MSSSSNPNPDSDGPRSDLPEVALKAEPESDPPEPPSSSNKVRVWPPLSGALADANDEDDEFPLFEVSGVYSDPAMQLCQTPELAGYSAHPLALYYFTCFSSRFCWTKWRSVLWIVIIRSIIWLTRTCKRSRQQRPLQKVASSSSGRPGSSLAGSKVNSHQLIYKFTSIAL